MSEEIKNVAEETLNEAPVQKEETMGIEDDDLAVLRRRYLQD